MWGWGEGGITGINAEFLSGGNRDGYSSYMLNLIKF